MPADHVTGTSNETGTEWSNNYSSIAGLWDQTQRGNGAKIWYDFKTDGTYTLNYDMRGNGDKILDQGNWVYAGNRTYDLISNSWVDHRHIYMTIDMEPDRLIPEVFRLSLIQDRTPPGSCLRKRMRSLPFFWLSNVIR